MRLATYNIWNSPAGMPLRLAQIVNEIVNQNMDIVCLQEVADIKTQDELVLQCKYPYSCFYPQAGLLVLSRLPIEGSLELPYALAARVTENQKSIILINVHLPWDSVIKQENTIVEITERTRQIQTDYMFILGDFNNSENSSIYRFLKNEQSLQGCEAYFYDLAEAFAEITGTAIYPTLNFRENPRWGVFQKRNTIEVSRRFDFIMLKNPYPKAFPTLKKYGIFGRDISKETGLAASDHYGVCVELEF
ncbi:MAG: hypothetical protein HFH81_03195 [Lachnospiraceae bacterium]|jgi:endonuclease/exonuclease/phosphatase family metal-dependent hydrolase|nr:hypothetical protein [Lachnospiraceae bacterium]